MSKQRPPVLGHCGLINDVTSAQSAQQCDQFDVTHPDAHVYAGQRGLFEPKVCIGANVQSGDVIGAIYPLEHCDSLPVLVNSPISGTVLCNRPMPLIQKGDCLFQIGRKLTD